MGGDPYYSGEHPVFQGRKNAGRPGHLFFSYYEEDDLGAWQTREKKAGELVEGMLINDRAVSAKAMF